MIGIEVKNFGVSFKDNRILENVSFCVKDGEIVSILGPSGSGKSTILRSLSSLQKDFEGEIILNENCLIDKQNECNSNIGYIFQDYALFPHLNVKENIGFALFNLTKAKRDEKVEELLEQFDLKEHKNKQIHQLSGGQQQRVSIARAIAYNPKVLLLDEPFSNLDSILRNKTKIWLKEVIKKLGLSAILVTHDKKEALSISDKIGIIQDKTLVQFGTPKELFLNPINLYVAQFLGDINILPNDIATSFGYELKEDEVAIIRVINTKVTTIKNEFELGISSCSFCGDYYEVILKSKNDESNTLEAHLEVSLDIENLEKIYLEISKDDIMVVNK